ncbi:hypothetical protein D3C81_1370260 [compost metagenome]
MTHGIGQQVAQRPLQQLLIGTQFAMQLIVQPQVAVIRQRFKIITQLTTNAAQIQSLQIERALGLLGAGKEHQVFRHALEPFELFHVRGEDFLILLGAARMIQRLTVARQQGVQRRTYLVGEVGGKLREALHAVVQPRQHAVERLHRLK